MNCDRVKIRSNGIGSIVADAFIRMIGDRGVFLPPRPSLGPEWRTIMSPTTRTAASRAGTFLVNNEGILASSFSEVSGLEPPLR
jgi:hypothetical protein